MHKERKSSTCMKRNIKILAMMATLLSVVPVMAQNVQLKPVKMQMAPQPENQISTTGLSCNSAFLMADLMSGKLSPIQLQERYAIDSINNMLYVSAIVSVDDPAVFEKVVLYGVLVDSRVGSMATVHIPLDRFVAFVQSRLCSMIQVSNKMELDNEQANSSMRTDKIYQGHMLPHTFDGTGVIVGIIDIGFEYGHPSFFDTTGTRYRVKCVWDQTIQCDNHPAGYSYGKEFLTQSAILNAHCSHTDETHGSHVAGIAAGSGGATPNTRKYQGIAPNADLVLVATNMYDGGIYDGINYIKNYANSLGMPCVINMSLGSQVGPHDGTSLFDRMVDSYVGNTPGLLVVASAGNEGGSSLHLGKTFVDDDTIITSFVQFTESRHRTYLDLWGIPGDTFSVQLGIVNTLTGDFEDATFLYSSAYSTNYQVTLFDADGENCELDIYCSSAQSHNGRPNITIYANFESQTSDFQKLCLRIVGHETTVHCWANSANFVNGGVAGAVSGNNQYTTGEIGIGKTMITVGSYMSRKNWTSVAGETYGFGGFEGELSYFSSHGPTLDGRIKPDIVGPGQMIYSAINRYNTSYANMNSAFTVDAISFNGHTEFYGAMQGTSMSAPAVTGVMALWLQANPYLTQTQAHQLIHNSGLQDGFTGFIPETGNSLWGWGKINAYAGLPVTSDTVMDINCRVDVFPYIDNFESHIHCWTADDSDLSGSSWQYSDNVRTRSGSHALVSLPSANGVDHTVLSPEIFVPENDSNWSVTWYAGGADASQANERYNVCIVANGRSRLIYQGVVNAPNMTLCGANIDEYRGDKIRIKIVHMASGNVHGLVIDDVSVLQAEVVPQPAILTSLDSTTDGTIYLPKDQPVNFTATVLNGAPVSSYYWMFPSANVPSSTSQVVDNVMWVENGLYQVALTATNEAGSSTAYRTVNVGGQGIESADSHVSIMPNPTSGPFRIVGLSSEIKNVQIFDALGRRVFSTESDVVDITPLPYGVYVIRIVTTSGTTTSRIVKR